MIFSLDLLFEAVVFGVLLGCFYAAVSIGLSVSFGLLDVPHVAHPALMVFGAYCTWLLGRTGLDPIVAGIVLMPAFFLLGMAIYRFYYEVFERRGSDAGVRGIAFFFGVALIIEVGLVLLFGVDQRTVEASYVGSSVSFGEMRIPQRFLVACGVALALMAALRWPVEDLHRARDQGGGAGRARAAPDGRRPGAHQAVGLRHRHRSRGAGGRAADHHRAGRAGPGPRLHRAHLQRGGARGPGEHDRHYRCRPDPRHLGVHRADAVRCFLKPRCPSVCCWWCSASGRRPVRR
jgi:hypothetical protein